MSLIAKAQEFAHDAHDSILQKRKYSNEPYWVHTDAVAAMVEQVFREANAGQLSATHEKAVAAAHLHDVLEDVFPKNQHFSHDLILKEFGREVLDMVKHLTDVYTKESYPSYNRAQRKKMERDRIAQLSPDIQTVKLADLICNTESIVAQDPDFAKVYLKEKFQLLPALVNGNSGLLARASAQTLEGFAKLGLQVPTIVGG
jgi:guanosine-3',5'-bis(diphosphate) 3'-pyrophosphohydrolase